MIAGSAIALILLADAPWLTVTRERGAEVCPDAVTLAAAVEAELERERRDELPGRSVRCALRREGAGWEARIEIDQRGERAPAVRNLRAGGVDCGQLSSALALTLTLALSAAGPPPPVEQQTDADGPPSLSLRPPVKRPSSRLSAGAVISAGALLDVAVGIELGGRRRFDDLVLGLEARFDRALPAHHGPATLEGWRVTGAIVPCFAPGRAGLCGVARAGAFAASSRDIAASRSGRGAIAELGARATWQLGTGVLGLAFYLEGTVPLLRTRLLIDGRPAWTSPLAVLSAGVTLTTNR